MECLIQFPYLCCCCSSMILLFRAFRCRIGRSVLCKCLFSANFPLNEEIGCTSSSEDDEDPGCMRPKRPRIEKPWSELLFSKQRVETTPSVLLGISPEYELEFRRYLSDTILTLVQKLNLYPFS